ncbi:hypothetical protein PPERSA_04668 [Pseudocohnilembus persalinus]|uniref:Uncharacterized protein n=1 Tax=Pseudocohnilembus persalinus TaxID=266149 RepID=A0A0V0R4F3_PSEPJ|nr:hypothetical protein PPERSA_04668 [Pseudocohnilembus persalinus]|eukprot:KRX09362.1 hypothetical protein PPERSA_04668 [Pseudocohnilembus persalinus]
MRVHTSVHLKKLDDAIFNQNIKITQEQDVYDLLLGNEAEGEMGLLQICGQRIKEKKKSSYYAIRILYQLLANSNSKTLFIDVFKDLEEDDYKLIKLDYHLLSKDVNQFAAYKIISLIQDKRPYLDISTFIESKKALSIYEKWKKDQKNVIQQEWDIEDKSEEIKQEEQKLEMLKQESYTEQEIENIQRLSDQKNSLYNKRNQKMLQEKKFFEQIFIHDFERNHNYYLNSFHDPLRILSQQNEQQKERKSTSNKAKKAQNLLSQKIYRINIKEFLDLQKIEKFSNKKIEHKEELEKEIQKYVQHIMPLVHIDSQNFDPVQFLSIVHADTEKNQLQQALQYLEKNHIEQKLINQSIISHFFYDFFQVENLLNNINYQFIQPQKSSTTSMASIVSHKIVNVENNNFNEVTSTLSILIDLGSCLDQLEETKLKNKINKLELLQMQQNYKRNNRKKLTIEQGSQQQQDQKNLQKDQKEQEISKENEQIKTLKHQLEQQKQQTNPVKKIINQLEKSIIQKIHYSLKKEYTQQEEIQMQSSDSNSQTNSNNQILNQQKSEEQNLTEQNKQNKKQNEESEKYEQQKKNELEFLEALNELAHEEPDWQIQFLKISQIKILPNFKNVSSKNLPLISDTVYKIINIVLQKILEHEKEKEEKQKQTQEKINQTKDLQLQQQQQQMQQNYYSNYLVIIQDLLVLSSQEFNIFNTLVEQLGSDLGLSKHLKKRIYLEIMTSKPLTDIKSNITNCKNKYILKQTQEIISEIKNYIVQFDKNYSNEDQVGIFENDWNLIRDNLVYIELLNFISKYNGKLSRFRRSNIQRKLNNCFWEDLQ